MWIHLRRAQVKFDKALALVALLTVAVTKVLVEGFPVHPSAFKHVVVVGGGVGGLATACRIAAQLKDTVKVTILEKNAVVGGRCGSFSVTLDKGHQFRHERGPSLLLLPQVYQQLFLDCGTTAEQMGLHIKRCVPAYQVVFDDGARINLGFPQGHSKMCDDELESRQIMNSFEPNGAEKWDAYMRTCEAYLDCGLPNFIEERLDLPSFPAFIRESLRDFGKAWPLKPHSDVLDDFFVSHKMRALASFQDLYVGLEPYRNDKLFGGGVLKTTAPAVFGLLSAIELHPTNIKCGVFAPVGGFGEVASSLKNLAASLGVNIQCDTTVTKVCQDGVYHYKTGHVPNGDEKKQFLAADMIVINADLPYATKVLLPRLFEERGPEIDYSLCDRFDWAEHDNGRPKYEFSFGVIAFHWSIVGKELSDLKTHNVFLSADTRSDAEVSWKVEGKTISDKEPFNFYVHRATHTDHTAASKVSLLVSFDEKLSY